MHIQTAILEFVVSMSLLPIKKYIGHAREEIIWTYSSLKAGTYFILAESHTLCVLTIICEPSDWLVENEDSWIIDTFKKNNWCHDKVEFQNIFWPVIG